MRSAVVRKEEKKKISPVWRGVGCLLAVAIFIVSFILAEWINSTLTDRANPPVLPAQLKVLPLAFRQMNVLFIFDIPYFGRSDLYVNPRYLTDLLLAGVSATLIFGLITALYSLFRGNINDPRDARTYQPAGRRKRNVRKCR